MLEREQRKIVILEQDHSRRDFLRSVLEADAGLTFCFDNVSACFDNLSRLKADLILVSGIPQPGLLRFINAHNATECRLPTLVMTRDQAIKTYLNGGGVNQIQVKDVQMDPEGIHRSIRQVLQESQIQELNNGQTFIVGRSPGMVAIKNALPDLTRSRECVLIEGEEGTGKEMIARAIHGGHIARDVFIKISARYLYSEKRYSNLSESNQPTIQPYTRPSEGSTVTIFIKELGYLPEVVQAEVLNLFDNMQMGKKRSDRLRIIASTSIGSDLLQSDSRFRSDLFYRLNVINIKIDPLRDRKEDIPLLTDFFSYRLCKFLERSFFELPDDILAVFMDYHWPGNVAELESVVKRTIVNGDDGQYLKEIQRLSKDAYPPLQDALAGEIATIDNLVDSGEYLAQAEQRPLKEICSEFMAKVEKKVMKKALEATNWNRKRAAELLNISYKSMLNKIKEYGLA